GGGERLSGVFQQSSWNGKGKRGLPAKRKWNAQSIGGGERLSGVFQQSSWNGKGKRGLPAKRKWNAQS
ncbi:hypothetical protein CQA15_29700, partial [Klebsiella pneumoniae]